MKSPGENGDPGYLVLKRVTLEREQDLELAQVIIAQVNHLKVIHAMRVDVQLGPIGPIGVIVLLTVTGVSNQEPENVLMAEKVIVPGMPLMKKNATYNRVLFPEK